MDVVELYKDALTYPTKDFKKIITLGAVILAVLIPMIIILVVSIMFNSAAFTTYQYTGDSLTALSSMGLVTILLVVLFSILVSIIYYGYSLSIIRKTIALDEELPEFEWGQLIVDGIKVLILSIVYSIIPAIVAIVLLLIAGVSTAAVNSPSVIFANSFLFLIIFIVAIVFELLLVIATARLAETDSLAAAINIVEIFDKIGQIGWANFIIWVIVLIIVSVVLGIIIGLIGLIPIIGGLITILIGYPYILMFSARATGLIYNEGK